MSLHKLTAGSGYEYLTRQVAVQDVTERGASALADYYTDRGESPGVWVGSGVAGIDGLEVGDEVTATHMRSLFGSGRHPLAVQRRDALPAGTSTSEVAEATQLGRPFNVFTNDLPSLAVEVARRVERQNVNAELPAATRVPLDVRAKIRSEVAAELFEASNGRAPNGPRELASAVARFSRPKTTAVAGYDMSFSPVKSVSSLWAVAERDIAAKIEQAHDAAVRDALNFIEKHALFTRTGPQGVEQVDVRGLVAAAFTHRDSRAGDPDLHTHTAISNKVQTLAGKWLAIDGRVLFKATVTASETYNTALERHLVESLGVRFAVRSGTDPRKRPVREIVGVDPALNARWSSRRAAIDVRRAELATKFQQDHGRPPSPTESIQLAQQATLETREAKHEPRSFAEQRAAWHEQAVDVLGDQAAVDRMVSGCLGQVNPSGERVTAEWVKRTASTVVDQVQARRATWQSWHLRAEALRQIRSADVSAAQVEAVMSLVVEAALELSVELSTDRDDVAGPAGLRRADGSSVFHVAGSDVFTSRAVLDAEERIVAASGRADGRVVAEGDIAMALLECAANGTELNPGQTAMVASMASSGVRVQLGIAAAGTGKTTAMSALTSAWEESGGNVIGLAPSAAAAAALGEQTGATTDTVAKLINTLNSPTTGAGSLADLVGPGTLVLIDEAGMADTLSLDQAITYVLARGGSIRLIGDDQQLSAIGAGGVLRDIANQHGALRLTELMRFGDPAEGAASLALRDGLTEGLGYYLDNDRVHNGDLTTETDEVFNAWNTDRAAGLDSIMLAPTRDLVAELNARARDARLADVTGAGGDVTGNTPVVRLSDGNTASVGDIVISRQNNRRLRASSTDWVRNGDRWTVTAIKNGTLTVRHNTSSLHVVLPAAYVIAHTELGYASTIHTAQGVSVDTMHGLATGVETRQQLYTMMTRGRHANHVYLVTASDGDPHNLIRPETIHPQTSTDILEGILARDGSPKSATTIAREAVDPSTLLGQQACRYVATLHRATEAVVGPERVGVIEDVAEHMVPGISEEPAWPTLRAHLLLIDAGGRDATIDLSQVVAERELDGVKDRAAILDWRIDPTNSRSNNPTTAAPLPWMPAVPVAVADSVWGACLQERATRIGQLVPVVRAQATDGLTPAWALQGGARPTDQVLADVAVWRAANTVPDTDRRPTGPLQMQKAAARHQRRLNERVNVGRAPALAEWGPLLDSIHPRRDAFSPLLASRLAALSRTGLDAAALLRQAVSEGTVPDDHVAAALWWRISRHLFPATAHDPEPDGLVAGRLVAGGPVARVWSDLLLDQLGEAKTAQLLSSPWWATATASMDEATSRGWSIPALLDLASTGLEDVDPAQALVWRIALMTDPAPQEDLFQLHPPPDDLEDALPDLASMEIAWRGDDLAAAALDRDFLGPLEPTDREMAQLLEHAYLWDHSPVTGDRIIAINQMTTKFFEQQFRASWAQPYLYQRLGQDIGGDNLFRPGYAPAGWTHLVNHLRATGVTDEEMLAAGVATTASTGRLIDRFRDRAILPIISEGKVLGFVGRRNPDIGDATKAGPKYLNTADTTVFHKGSQLYGLPELHTARGAIPVLVEGPLDAIAVTIASGGAFVGVAPLGTSLTGQQARQLADLGVNPIVATDGDLAGRIAAERDYWLLAPHLLSPRFAQFAPGDDPARILERDGAAHLVVVLQQSGPLADKLIGERCANVSDVDQLLAEVAQVVAVGPSSSWGVSISAAATNAGVNADLLQEAVVAEAKTFVNNRAGFSDTHLTAVAKIRARIEQADNAPPAERWGQLARGLDQRLLGQRDWPETAAMIQQIHDNGTDVQTLLRHLIDESPLANAPARELRYRLLAYLPDEDTGWTGPAAPATDGPSKHAAARPARPARPQHPVDSPQR